jgi:dTMP kinase
MSTRGIFITVEGIEGSGKSTQLKRLSAALKTSGRNVVVTREPGGTPLAERIRAVLLDPQEEGMDPIAELFLYAAARRQHVADLIRPALETGALVLSDRFTDATLAYQGFGRLLELDQLRLINQIATGGLEPDLTLVFDLSEVTGLGRARARNVASNNEQEGRLEGEDLKFHRRVREGYLSLAQTSPRFAVIDADGSVEEVEARVNAAIAKRFPQLQLS